MMQHGVVFFFQEEQLLVTLDEQHYFIVVDTHTLNNLTYSIKIAHV